MRNYFQKAANLFKWTYHKYRYRGPQKEHHKHMMNMGNKTSARRGHATEESSSPMFTFFAIGDFGVPNELIKQTARAMDGWAKEHGAPNIILGLGDNFYPCGVGSADDENFCTCWSDIFLIYETLRVPWKMVLGNHDYMWEPQAQIDFHYNKALNKGGLWNMPATCYRFSESVSHTAIVETAVDSSSSQPVETSTVPATPDTAGDFKIDFFAIDTNACQYHVARVFPDLVDTLLGFVDQLHTSLVGSNADWKIVFGHHPMYTQGKGHGEVGQCLRADYHPKERPKRPDYDGVRMPKGFGLEKALSTGGVHAYFSAHEHVFQHHVSKGVHSFVCGASGAEQRSGSGLYGGVDKTHKMDWVCTADEFGFVAAKVYRDRMVVQFVSAAGVVLREVCIDK